MEETCEKFLFVFRGVLSILLCIVGLIGNTLSLIVLKKIGRSSVTFCLLRTLAVCDAIYLLTYILTAAVPEFFYFTNNDLALAGDFQYVIWGVFPISSMALTATVWITTLVTVHRYIAVSHHTKKYFLFTMKGVMLQVVIVIFCAVLMDIPKYFELTVVTLDSNGTSVKTMEPTELWHDRLYQLLYKNIAMVGLRKILPIIITFVLTILLVRAMIERKKRHDKLKKNDCGDKPPDRKERVSIVLITVASVFVLCQTPMAIYPLFRLIFDIDNNGCEHFYYYFSNVADWLAVVNSAANFFIYYPVVPTFREKLKDLFSTVSQKSPIEDRDPMSQSYTHNRHESALDNTTNTANISNAPPLANGITRL